MELVINIDNETYSAVKSLIELNTEKRNFKGIIGKCFNAVKNGVVLPKGHGMLEQEPCKNCCNGNQIEKAKLCQKSYLAGMEHKQELILDKIRAEIEKQYKWLMTKSPTIYMMDIAFDAIRKAVRDEVSKEQQEPKTGYISIDDVMSVFDDFICGEVDEDGTETFLEMLKDKAENKVEDGNDD